jgi:dTMP kinase
VISDRFVDSTRIYQGVLGNLDPRLISRLEKVTIGDTMPDLTIILDVPVEIGLKRAAARRGNAAPDRFESEDIKFHQKLRDGYREIAAAEPKRCVLIDASADPDTVAAGVWAALRDRFFAAPAASVASRA